MIAEKKYKQECNRYNYINEHLPTLRRYAEKCEHITEFGTGNIISTWAFILGKPKSFFTYDINHPPKELFNLVKEAAKELGVPLMFIQNSVLDVIIEPTDLLFIDTLHTGNQMRQELRLHADKVRKYIIFHDTETFGTIGEGKEEGILPPIREFLNQSKDWVIEKVYKNCNGLMIIRRK